MLEFLRNLFGADTFMPHGFCLNWDPLLVTLMVTANAGIALAYFAIPAGLIYFVRNRKDLPYPWLFKLFGLFIVACGTSHLMKILTIYTSFYWPEAIIDMLTAIVSLTTAFLFWPLIPKALSLRSPIELASVNEKLEATNQQLNTLNQQLSAVNRDLQTARDQALEASNLKSTFVANISHELRTPISGILGMNELLLATKLDTNQHELANAIQDSSHSLLAIVNDILDLSKIEAGKLDLENVQLNPVAVVHECVQVLAATANKKKLLVKTDLDARLPSQLYGDPVRLHQVLLNLFGNAIKFTQIGSITIRAVIESEDGNTLNIKFIVSDTGVGLSDEEQKYLFQPFTQIDNSTTRQHGGTGLGLVISKHLVELMGGEIGVTSTKGSGASFWFIVPFKRGDMTLPEIPKAESVKQAATSNKIILIAEDNSILQNLITKQLEHLGVKSFAVADGRAVIEELDRHNYNLILLDCHMPGLDGFEVTRIIRQREKNTKEHIPIIAMTAGALSGDYEKCMESGMDDYISKPYTLNQLKQKIEHWLTTKV
jgi:signal transduction histidine kinase/CheY-like chemotaxis protein